MVNDKQIIESKAELAAWLEAGCKPPDQWRIGTEHEKFIFNQHHHTRVPYDGDCSIKALLKGLAIDGWSPVLEQDQVIALKGQAGDSITLEPGGQFELSGAPVATIHETCDEIHSHLAAVKAICTDVGALALGIGFDPISKREDIHWMPKERYRIMRRYMPTRGQLGLDMMLRTCTVQVNLDFASEADMRRKVQIATLLQPIAIALFANSPFREGRPSGFQSTRILCWTDTDPDRCGTPSIVLEDQFGFEQWVDYALDVPMYFVARGGIYHDTAGASFKDFMAGSLSCLPGERPTFADWSAHLTTIFTEVRLKQFIEMRGADGGAWNNLCALPALWTGLLYDATSLDEAGLLADQLRPYRMAELTIDAARSGLAAQAGGRSFAHYARDMVAIAKAGLQRRGRMNPGGFDEGNFLDLVEEFAFTGQTLADQLLDRYHHQWGGDVCRVFTENAY